MVELNNTSTPMAQPNTPHVLMHDAKTAADPAAEKKTPTANEHGAIGVVRKDEESPLSTFTRSTVSIAEFLAATPLVMTSLLTQADNIAKHGASANDEGMIGLFSSIIETLSTPFRFALNFIGLVTKHGITEAARLSYLGLTDKDAAHLVNDVSVNKRSFFFDDIYQRLLHTSIAKEFTSFLFTFRRSVFNFFPSTFTVPSEEHNPDAPEGRPASAPSTNLINSLAKITSPLKWVSSLAGLLIIAPARLLSSYFAFSGNQKLYDSFKEISSITEYFNPIIANLSSTFSVAKAYLDSFIKKESTLVTFGKYNITSLNLIQGFFGAFLSIPQFFGALSKIKNKLFEKDENSKLSFVKHIRNIVGELAPKLKGLGPLGNHTVAGLQDRAEEEITKFLSNSYEKVIKFTHSAINSSSFLQKIFGYIRPIDIRGNVLVEQGNSTVEPKSAEEKYFAGTLRRNNFFSELYDLLQPLQSMLMLLPNTFVPVGDPYITDNAIKPFRILDRLLGVNSMILSIPNYLVYVFSTRIPQMILKYFEIKQRKAELQDNTDNYSAFREFVNFKEVIAKYPVFGSTYLSKILGALEVNRNTFNDPSEMAKVYESLEKSAIEQEASVKASELVGAFRIGVRTLLGKKLFVAERDEATGLTAEEVSRDKVYNSLGSFKTTISGIPVIGWIAAPIIEIFRKMYHVDTKRTRKRLPGLQSNANDQTKDQATPENNNPLAALINQLNQANTTNQNPAPQLAA